MNFIFLILSASIVSSSAGFILKLAMRNMDGSRFLSIKGIVSILFSPLVIAGLSIYFVGAIVWMKVLSKYELSVAYPTLVGTSFVIITAISILGLREDVNFYKLLGILGILAGITLIVKNQ
jgi:multidrug transporter EmrE-like cation transporter